MKFFLGILALLVVSACAVEIKPKSIDYEQYRTYVYEYVGNVLTGIPFSSSLYSGTQLKANVGISHIQHNKDNLYTLKLQNVTFHSLIDEVTEPVKANFARRETLDEKAKDVLELTFQYAIDNATQRLQWIEVDKEDEPWSLNIKKAIIEMFLVDIAGKQLKLNPDYEHSLIRRSDDEVHHGFDVYEPTSKGECETMYQVYNTLPESVQGQKGLEQFYWKVMKTRNYQNCTSSPKLTQHNWERKGCAEYCKQALILGQTQMHNHYSAERSQCNCDDIEAEPLDQQSTTSYYIECKENPYILYAENNGKVVFDNHGTKFVSFTNQTLTFKRVFGGYYDAINKHQAIRVSNLTFSLIPYTSSVAQVLTHEIPAYNLLVPRTSQSSLFDNTVELLNQVAEVVVGKSEEKQNIAGFMARIIQNLAHLDSEFIMRIYREYANVSIEKLYTNTVESVRRQLFLDAITHVGTTNVSLWLERVLESDSEGLYPIEVRQVIETLPLNVYAPTKSLIELLQKKMNTLIQSEEWDQLSVYVVAYGKLIAKACPNTVAVFESDNEIHSIPIRTRSNDWLIPEKEKCTDKQTVEYIEDLVKMLEKTEVIRGKLLIAQALAHTGKTLALEALAPYAKGEFKCPTKDVSDCIFYQTSVIYSLHHLSVVEPKRVRSLVLPIFNTKTESYELRLAAFTVLMSAGPQQYELESVAVSLRNETSLQVISMVRSILEETANLTQACNQPLAKAAREVIATLPKVNINGLYSQTSYNEWYSTDKSTGFFANGQFVANNISVVPRHGYLNIGSHWKSLSNPWLTVAFQQKGFETAFRNLLKNSASYGPRDPLTIEQLWEDLKVVARNEDNFMLKLFVRVYEQTSLFTLDKYSLNVLYAKVMDVYERFSAAASKNEVDFNWVRFYMPSTYTDVVPSAVGLPVIATKQNRQIVSLRLDQAEFETSESQDQDIQRYTFKVTPQVFTSSYLALSVFNQGIKTPSNYGVYNVRNFTFYVPLHLNFNWNKVEKSFTYSIKPVFNKINFLQSNKNYAFIAPNYIGTVVKAVTQEITSLVPTYHYPLMQFKSRALGMNLNLRASTERPWFLDLTSIPCDGTVAWLLEKYNEMNQFNSNMNLTLVQNEDFPAAGIAGSISFGEFLGGNYESIDRGIPSDSETNYIAEIVAKELRKLYPSLTFSNSAFYSRSMKVVFSTLGQSVPTTFNTVLTMVKAIDHHAYWYRFNSSIESINEQVWIQLPRQFIADGKLERPTIPSDLKWFLRNPEKLVGNYKVVISWNDEITPEHVDYKILINGDLRRSVRDPVIPEMERQSWFHKQCEKDIKNGHATNYACELVAAHQAYFNKVNGDIDFKNVEEPVRRSFRFVYSEAKRALINYWKPWSTVSTKDLESMQDFANFEVLYSNIIYKRPVISLTVQTPTELVNFTRFIVPVETFPTLIPMGYLKASPLPKDQTCTVMKDSVRTFDNVTYRTWTDECEFVVAMDCNEMSKKFAVTVKGKAGKRSVRVYTPRQTYLKIRDVKKDQASLTIHGANDEQIGEDYIVKTGVPVLHISDNGIKNAHQVFMHDGVVNVILPSENVRVAFDGYYLKVTTSPLYIGKTCGLCGNQNQERTYEFVDPELKDLESNLTAFRDSYSLHDCTDPNPCHDDVCDEETPVHYGRRNNYIAAPKKNTRTTESGEHKTIVERRGNVNCFSKYPKLMCKEGQKALKTEAKIIDWVCFEQQHPIHMKWLEMAERGTIIPELAQMETTNREAYESPVECVSVRGI